MFLAAGTIKLSHLYPALCAVPFAWAWRGSLRDNLDTLEAGASITPDRPRARTVAIALSGVVLSFVTLVTAAGWRGDIERAPSCGDADRDALSTCDGPCAGLSEQALDACLTESCPDLATTVGRQCLTCLSFYIEWHPTPYETSLDRCSR